MEEKQQIREFITERKKRMSQSEIQNKSKTIIEKLIARKEYIDAESIYSYINFNQEVETIQLLLHALEQGKKIAIPKVHDQKMEFFYIESLSQLQPGYMGILEPTTGDIAKDKDALLVMPGVAFDEEKNRIGYGRGYYDTYLNLNTVKSKIALAYDLQIVDKIACEEFDVKPDCIITEKREIN